MHALRTMIGLSKADTEAIVASTRVPALVVMGTRDPDFPNPVAEAQWLGQALDTSPVIIEGAGHYPHLETPERVAPALLAFLARVWPR
jgi:pimeloyl-ACP methyl ester carboxylesterase